MVTVRAHGTDWRGGSKLTGKPISFFRYSD
ncbi:MAG: hypothetical protein RIQ93_259 [Verrucomicrobiota bacterium]|jgi:hypothetical protein